jgi:hypothetical protein
VTKILLIEPDLARAAALATALGRDGGAQVRIAPDCFYALTLIERERPDLIVAGTCLGGIGAGELAAIVRSDPALAGVRLALYASQAAPPAGLDGGGVFDLVLDAAASAPQLAASLRGLAGLAAAPPPPPAPPARFDTVELPAPEGLRAKAAPPAQPMAAPAGSSAEPMPLPASPVVSPRSPDLSGSLGVLDLMELSQAFSLASKTGLLFLDCPRGEGCIYFELGKVIHATIRDRAGRDAFSEILQATLRERNIAFRFAPREQGELGAVPRTIDLTVQHLLLSFAVDFDETQES